jgi:hypothetical protein
MANLRQFNPIILLRYGRVGRDTRWLARLLYEIIRSKSKPNEWKGSTSILIFSDRDNM